MSFLVLVRMDQGGLRDFRRLSVDLRKKGDDGGDDGWLRERPL